MCHGMDQLSIAVPITERNAKPQAQLAERWRKVLFYERTNPLRLQREDLQGRVTLVYQQASMCLAFHAETWHAFMAWLDLGGQKDKATQCLQNAVDRFLPQDMTLRLLIAHRYELAEAPPTQASLQAAEDAYKSLLRELPKPSPLALVNYLAFIRRQRGATDFREAYVDAFENSPHCTWEVYVFAALSEYHVFGSVDAAAKVFQLGVDSFGDKEPSLLVAYTNFLTGANDLKSARAEVSKGVLGKLQRDVREREANHADPAVRDSLAFLWQKWARLERYFGDAGSVRQAICFQDEEYRHLQQDQNIEKEVVQEAPVALEFSATIESFRFMHLVPQTARAYRAQENAASSSLRDQAVSEAAEGGRHTTVASSAAPNAAHIGRPDVSKMLAFRPALDVVGQKRSTAVTPEGQQALHAEAEETTLPAMIPKCLQDLLAVLPTRPLKGTKPDVDYLLTVLQTVTVPNIPLEDMEQLRYDSLSMRDNGLLGATKRRIKQDPLDLTDDADVDFFGGVSRSLQRDQLHAKRAKVYSELMQAKTELRN